ncbi:MAG TPA: transglutaminase domain-containing protein [Anaeromyxobacteraceae bacterium]|nr:transglutaminase domain-containing protein [Anaeromyxobacteraceae bacterium]
MVPLCLALALAAAPPALPSVEARYRVEIGGVAVGWARLATRCETGGCDGTWESVLRAPAEGGGETVEWHAQLRTSLDGRARGVRVRILAEGRERRRASDDGPVPASLAELLLSQTTDGERRCLTVRDEESGEEGEACAVRRGAWLEAELLGVPLRFRAAPGAAPEEVVMPAQATRFIADPAAALPARPPRLFGLAAPTPRSGRFCDHAADPAPPAAPAALPREFPPGASCRERTARYLALASRAGLRGRHAIGLAHDGRSLVWHEWAELLAGDRWIPIDPSFEQAPARGERFTVARYEDGDERARAAAGRAVLACWIAGGRGD